MNTLIWLLLAAFVVIFGWFLSRLGRSPDKRGSGPRHLGGSPGASVVKEPRAEIIEEMRNRIAAFEHEAIAYHVYRLATRQRLPTATKNGLFELHGRILAEPVFSTEGLEAEEFEEVLQATRIVAGQLHLRLEGEDLATLELSRALLRRASDRAESIILRVASEPKIGDRGPLRKR